MKEQLVRQQGHIPDGHEDRTFRSIAFETFSANAARLERWAHAQQDERHVLLDMLREVLELKKLNSTLMKPGILDDLIGDTYACIYEQIIPGLLAASAQAENRDRMRVDHLLTNPDPPAATTTEASPVPTDTGGEQTTTKTRAKIVGRQEVRKRAEGLIVKPPPIPMPKPRLITAVPTPPLPSHIANPTAGVVEADSGVKDVASSGAGSVHDSADDESELSEIDDGEELGREGGEPGGGAEVSRSGEGDGPDEEEAEETIKPLFPGLVGRVEDDKSAAENEDASQQADEGTIEEREQAPQT